MYSYVVYRPQFTVYSGRGVRVGGGLDVDVYWVSLTDEIR